MSEEPEETKPAPSREWMKFIVLAVILVGVIIVMAVTRPLIFNRIVPAVMGEGQIAAPMPTEEPEETIEEAYPVNNDVGDESKEEGEMATAVSTISHTVQHGDTILNIARRYNVTIDAIVAANNISNPNHIEVGTTLLIPQP